MSQDLATRFIGYAPDQRDRDNPPEVVYWTETPKRAPLWKRLYLIGAAGFFLWLTFAALQEALTIGVPEWMTPFTAILVAIYMVDAYLIANPRSDRR